MTTSRERLQATLAHRAPDRIPVDFGSTPVTGIHVRIVEALGRELGLAWKPVKVIEPYQMLGEVDEALAEAMGVDVVGLSPRNTMFGFENAGWREYPLHWGQTVLVPAGFQTTVEPGGDTVIYPGGDRSARPSGRMPSSGFFFDTIIRQEPIDEAKLDPADNAEDFALCSEADLAYWRRVMAEHRASTRGLVVNVGGTALGDIALVPGPGVKNPRGIRDVAEWYMTTMMRQDYVHALFERQTEIALKNLETLYGIIGEAAQAIFLCGTDFGTQNSQFCSPETFAELWRPYYRRLNDWIHGHTGWKVFKHSCGAVVPLIPSLIDAGFDILNPVQINAEGMDPVRLKREFGSQLTFWGGGADTQKVLPFATPAEVEAHVLRQCETLGRDGGFVFTTVHNVQANVPVENVLAMLRALRRANRS
jgi:hypothetical protein